MECQGFGYHLKWQIGFPIGLSRSSTDLELNYCPPTDKSTRHFASGGGTLQANSRLTPCSTLFAFQGKPPVMPSSFGLLSMGRLYTIDKLLSHQITTNPICILCGLYPETHEHLFFQCTYSARGGETS